MSLIGNVKLYLAAEPAVPLGDIEWYRGDTFPIALIAKQDGQAIDITGCSFVLTVIRALNPPDSSQPGFDAPGVVLANQETNPGRLYFLPTASETDLEPGKYFYGVKMVDGDGYIRTVAAFDWLMLWNVTKPIDFNGWDAVPDWDDVPDWDEVPGNE